GVAAPMFDRNGDPQAFNSHQATARRCRQACCHERYDMKTKQPRANALRVWTVSVGISLGTVILCGIAPGTTAGCPSNSPNGSSTACSSSTVPEVSPIYQRAVDKLDILLGIDNSRGMADKQEILAQTIPDLVLGLLNPPCVDDMGVPAAIQ